MAFSNFSGTSCSIGKRHCPSEAMEAPRRFPCESSSTKQSGAGKSTLGSANQKMARELKRRRKMKDLLPLKNILKPLLSLSLHRPAFIFSADQPELPLPISLLLKPLSYDH